MGKFLCGANRSATLKTACGKVYNSKNEQLLLKLIKMHMRVCKECENTTRLEHPNITTRIDVSKK